MLALGDDSAPVIITLLVGMSLCHIQMRRNRCLSIPLTERLNAINGVQYFQPDKALLQLGSNDLMVAFYHQEFGLNMIATVCVIGIHEIAWFLMLIKPNQCW